MNVAIKLLLFVINFTLIQSNCRIYENIFGNTFFGNIGAGNTITVKDSFNIYYPGTQFQLKFDSGCNKNFTFTFDVDLNDIFRSSKDEFEIFKSILPSYIEEIHNRVVKKQIAKLYSTKFNTKQIKLIGECKRDDGKDASMFECESELRKIANSFNVKAVMKVFYDLSVVYSVEDLPLPTTPEMYEFPSTTEDLFFDDSVIDHTEDNLILPLSTTSSSVSTQTEVPLTLYDVYDNIADDTYDYYIIKPPYDFFVERVTKTVNDFYIQAQMPVPWIDDFLFLTSKKFIKFSETFVKYTQAVYELDPIMKNSLIECTVDKISKDFTVYENGTYEFNINDIILSFKMKTFNLSITDYDVALKNGNVFDEIFKNFRIDEFLAIYNDGSDDSVIDEFDYDDDKDENVLKIESESKNGEKVNEIDDIESEVIGIDDLIAENTDFQNETIVINGQTLVEEEIHGFNQTEDEIEALDVGNNDFVTESAAINGLSIENDEFDSSTTENYNSNNTLAIIDENNQIEDQITANNVEIASKNDQFIISRVNSVNNNENNITDHEISQMTENSTEINQTEDKNDSTTKNSNEIDENGSGNFIENDENFSDDEDYFETFTQTSMLDILLSTTSSNHRHNDLIIETAEAYEIDSKDENLRKFLCKKCKIKITSNNRIEIIADEKETTTTEISSHNKRRNRNKSAEHSYIWRYFIKLHAESAYEHDGNEKIKMICEKCEIELAPDGKFQIIDTNFDDLQSLTNEAMPSVDLLQQNYDEYEFSTQKPVNMNEIINLLSPNAQIEAYPSDDHTTRVNEVKIASSRGRKLNFSWILIFFVLILRSFMNEF